MNPTRPRLLALEGEYVGLEGFPKPARVTMSRFEFADALRTMCPYTNQPDYYHVTITCRGHAKVLEAKSLKLWKQELEQRPTSAERLAHRIAEQVHEVTAGHVVVELRQNVRGGISITTIAEAENAYQGPRRSATVPS
jgi:NADPH-dependent 7-cyano-7-deazaguanine reductase QueF